MTPGDIDASVHRQLGEIAATLHALQSSIERVVEEARRSQDKSDTSRAAVHRRLDDVAGQVAGLDAAMTKVKSDITDMKPVTDDVKRWRLMGIGALAVVGIGGISLGAAIAGALEHIATFLSGGH